MGGLTIFLIEKIENFYNFMYENILLKEQEQRPKNSNPLKKSEDKLISSQSLPNISKTLELLRSEEGLDGKKLNWKELYKQVEHYNSILELSDNIREIVLNYVKKRISAIKKEMPNLADLDDKNLVNALVNNVFGEIEDDISGQRREILLMVMAQIVKRIETKIYLDVIKNANEADLKKIGIEEYYKDLLVQIMDISTKANPLFVRFCAYAQLSPNPPKEAMPFGLYISDKGFYTIASLFPHETKFISQKFNSLADDNQKWINKPGGNIFKQYLEEQAKLFSEINPELAKDCQERIEQLYAELIASEFPIIITPAGGYKKAPYYDPELKISITTATTKKQEQLFKNTQSIVADCLDEINIPEYKENMEKGSIKIAVSIGANGASLAFSSAAEITDATIILYLNDQSRRFDKEFPTFVNLVTNTEQEFVNMTELDRIKLMEKMSLVNTVMHEISHSVYPTESEEAKKIGKVQELNIDEIKAENLYPALVPLVIKKKGLEGNKNQWAIAMIASSIQLLKARPEGDPYYYAAVYSLNELFEQRVAEFADNKLTINDFSRYYEIKKSNTLEILKLYQDKNVNERMAGKWIEDNCKPNEKVKKLIEFIKQK